MAAFHDAATQTCHSAYGPTSVILMCRVTATIKRPAVVIAAAKRPMKVRFMRTSFVLDWPSSCIGWNGAPEYCEH